ELHRYHHSASSHEAQNYGVTLSIFDICFGTFHYRPGVAPEDLGLSERDGYPGQHDPLRATLFPFSVKPVSILPDQ
ncbi:MAG: sterol desaturase family protein, partial [Gammaproteobacteria bacterium]|nr:sterol desaturase family protein [Gammaproteobacteria bacterium]